MTFSLICSYCLNRLFLIVLLFSSTVGASDWIYTVAEGDNLWNLSEQHLDKVTRFEQLRKMNNIKNPKHLQPGTQIRVPLEWIRSNPVPAKVASFEGEAEIHRAKTLAVQPVNTGSSIYLGDQIKTASNSTISIIFADKSTLTIHENSVIRFDHLSAHGVTGMVDSRLNLIEGRMDTTVTPAEGPGSRFEIQTPSAISAVRGTIYRASVADAGSASNIEVLKGKVLVTGANKGQLINEGYGTQVVMGKAPLPPQELLAAPTFNTIPKTIEQVNSRISWAAIDGAKAYRLELADTKLFDTVRWQNYSQYNRAALPDVDDGNYFLRVRAVDNLGIEGLNRDISILLDAHPQPPLALTPPNKHVLRGQTPKLLWTGAEGISSYHLEIATDENFKQLVLDRNNIVDTHFDTKLLSKNGVYYWRLSSITTDGENGPVGPSRSYQIKPIPEKVEASLSALDDGLLVASWKESSATQHYRVQIASDKQFSHLTLDEDVSEPTVLFAPVEDTKRYLRVKGIEDDGYEGPWGATQTIEPLPKEDVSYWPMLVGAIFTIIVF